jgi:hypothetical protein
LAARDAARGDLPGQTERRRRVRLRRPGLQRVFRGDGNPVAAGRIAFKVSADQRARVVIEGVSCDARQIYLENERQELELLDQIPGNTEPTVYAVIRGVARTTREVKKYDPSVGGTIRYAFFAGAPNTLPMVRGAFSG